MAQEITIVGLPPFKKDRLEFLTLDENAQIIEQKAQPINSGSYIELTGYDKSKFLSLSYDQKPHITLHDIKKDTLTEFNVPEKLTLSCLFANPLDGLVYSWDWESKRLFSWTADGKLANTSDIESPPLSYLRHDLETFLGCLDGTIYLNGKKIAEFGNDKIKKMVVNENELIVIAAGSAHDEFFPLPSKVISLDSLKPKNESKFARRDFIDAVVHDGILYTATDVSIGQHTKERDNTKFLRTPGGRIRYLFPKMAGKDSLIFYTTNFGQLFYTEINDFENHPSAIPHSDVKPEKSRKVAGSGYYKSLVIIP